MTEKTLNFEASQDFTPQPPLRDGEGEFSAADLPQTAILYEDPHLLAVNKPAPLLTQAPPGLPSLEALAKAYLKRKHAKPAGVYLGIPHRLDRPVSGCVVFARNTKAAQRVHAQFAERTVKKTYWAWVSGSVTEESGRWDDWLKKLPEESRTVATMEGEAGAKLANLEFRVLKRETERTMLELRPLTGRMHQLRLQCSLRGHPVLGDLQYGSAETFGPPAELPRDRVIALHARELRIAHPFTKAELVFAADVPDYWPCAESRELRAES